MANGALAALVAVVFQLSLGCADDGADLSQLDGRSFTLDVDRIASNPDVEFPFEELREADYEESTEGSQYDVSFSREPETVTIAGRPAPEETVVIRGNFETELEDFRHYAIVEGLLAGGRFNVWIAEDQFQAELTVYGSGIPIIQSERGRLIAAD